MTKKIVLIFITLIIGLSIFTIYTNLNLNNLKKDVLDIYNTNMKNGLHFTLQVNDELIDGSMVKKEEKYSLDLNSKIKIEKDLIEHIYIERDLMGFIESKDYQTELSHITIRENTLLLLSKLGFRKDDIRGIKKVGHMYTLNLKNRGNFKDIILLLEFGSENLQRIQIYGIVNDQYEELVINVN